MIEVFKQIKTFPSDLTFTEGEAFSFTLTAQRTEEKESFKDIFDNEITKLNKPQANDGKSYKITVKKYMTEKGTPRFDFMTNWNNDVPMPFVTMVGEIQKETKGMYYMKLHGKGGRMSSCMCCGRKLTNKISMLYGLGPECGSHAYINPFDSEEELNACLDEVFAKIANVTWEGWVIKSAIKEMKEE